ncbi:MAG: twin-arginine translocase TatA/TatE family subunit [Pyrinomonadaceae bacterium]|nr:twin-arginine translocase TatA/TatE family subunit [Pyrinomonadaceae bacterium]MCX7640090.1 twin-arginine translocase TatA/TatE family subunit [Pyrinomonadaceae bacterium]MDW8304262.1 twin-arginine translocase TatA/TatE family subunit [Acidobacteriota bacterium]
MNLGTTEIILIVAVLFLLFGASRLPQLAKALGQSRKAFREGMREAEEEERREEERRLQEAKNVASLNPPLITEVDDETLIEELKRRQAQRQQNN